MPEFLSANLIAKVKPISRLQIEACRKVKKERLRQVQESEEFYYGKERVDLEGVVMAQLPTMSGFVDTLLSKIDDIPRLNFGYTDLADFKRAQKVQALWEQESGPNHNDWGLKDRWEKKLAIFQGMGISKVFAESDPKYKSFMEVKDLFNFIFEPKGGGDIDKHKFCGEENVWIPKSDLEKGIKSGLYIKKSTQELINSLGNQEHKDTNEEYIEETERYSHLGYEAQTNNYVGVKLAKLNEHYMIYNGKKYYLLLDYVTGFVVRAHELKDVFKSDKWPYNVWHTNPDAFNFLSKAPADDARPLATILDRLFSQVLTNREKINMGQRYFDPEMVVDPSQLPWTPDGLVEIDTGGGTTRRNIAEAVKEVQTKDIGMGTVDLMGYIKGVLGIETGVTAGAQGASDEDKVGIHFSNLQQVADRLGLFNKSYKENWAKKGMKYWWGLQEHLNEPRAIQILGSFGIEWDKIAKEDISVVSDLDIQVTGGQTEDQIDQLKKQGQSVALVDIRALDPNFEETNRQVFIKKRLELGGFEESDVKLIMSKDEFDLELMSEAEQAIQDILKGEEPQLNRGATIAFVKHILDYARDNIDFDENSTDEKEQRKQEQHDNLIAYANAHLEIVEKNTMKMAKLTPPPQVEEQPQQPTGQIPQPVEGQSQQFSQLASKQLQTA